MRTLPKHFFHLLRHPGRLLLSPFYRRIERYKNLEKFEIKFLLTDIFLLIIALGIITAAAVWLIRHDKISERIFFEAQIAPTEIVSGAPSTLVIRYTNGTGQELKDVYLNLTYPDHFELQELAIGETPVQQNTISLGNLAPDAIGSIKIHGIMFGDVGGEQIFESKMTFTYGEGKSGEKTSRHIFSPSASVLELTLEIPEKIVAGQSFVGHVVYKNAGQFALPEVKIKPLWPDNFKPGATSVDGWSIPSVEPNTEGRIDFFGIPVAGAENLSLSFEPSFVFGQDEYRQKMLNQMVVVILPQLKISHSVETASAQPGGTLKLLVQFENTGDDPIYGVEVSANSESLFVGDITIGAIGSVADRATGQTEIELKLQQSITQGQTATYEHLTIETNASASYKLEDSPDAQTITVSGPTISTPLTTPLTFRSFGRYATERGDQLGRGPLPPLVGEETKYWIFWNLSGTTNEIKNLSIAGELPTGVSFTGRQTVSTGSAITYDQTTKTVSWKVDEIATTFSPAAKVVGAAFEVAITPTAEQIGTSPPLINNISLTGLDGWTGVWLTASGSIITTNLPGDLMADGLGLVVD